MRAYEQTIEIPAKETQSDLIDYFRKYLDDHFPRGSFPIRFVVTASDAKKYTCEVGALEGYSEHVTRQPESIFEFRRRPVRNDTHFNVAMLVPTGVGAEIGGHAGDAGPAARLIGQTCDTLITHPNVVNASDINEMPSNGLYVEGSVLSRLLMGTVGLQRVRSNRLVTVIEEQGITPGATYANGPEITNTAENAVNAARAAAGIDCPDIVRMDCPFEMKAIITETGRAAGRLENLERLVEILDALEGRYNAIALSSVIKYPPQSVVEYFMGGANGVNPWGGVEAMLTHVVSSLYNLPSAHAPQMAPEVFDAFPEEGSGVVEPSMAAEVVSRAFIHCVFKGLQQSPQLVTSSEGMMHPSVLSAADVSCVVMPERCFGLPALAALEQGIPVILVKDQQNVMKNDLTTLPWRPGQLHVVDDYLQAAGLLCAMRGGVAVDSLSRPLHLAKVHRTPRERTGPSEREPEAVQERAST